MLVPKERDTYGIRLHTIDVLGLVNALHLGPMFTPAHLDLLPLFQGVPEETRERIVPAAQQNHKINSARVQDWQVKVDLAYRSCYSASTELIKGATKDLRCFAKFLGALDHHCQGLIRRASCFVRP